MKKTLATLLVVALVASLCGVMFVSAEAVNLVAGKTYEISEQYRMGGKEANWGYDPNAAISYPDENYELTDGLLPENQYNAAGWVGFSQKTPAQTERGYAYVIFDLGAVCEIDTLSYVAYKHVENGIQPAHTFEVYVSNDGENYELATSQKLESDALDALEDLTSHKFDLDLDTSAQYVKLQFASNSWAFLGEVEILGTAPVADGGNDEPAEPAEEMFWVTHYGDSAVEGSGVIFTEAYEGAVWWLHVAFAPIAGAENAYEIVAISDGTPEGHGVAQAIPEGGFVWASNYGNNYPAIGGYGDDAIDYTSPNCQGAIQRALTWQVGDQFVISGVDFETIPTSTPDVNWYDDAYVCTATIAPYVPGTTVKPVVPAVKETITVDGKLDDNAYEGAAWFSDGIWQSADGATLEDLDVAYTVRSDDDNIYLTIKVNQGVDFATALDPAAWDQSGATNFRIWVLGDGMSERVFFDLLWDGEAFVPFLKKLPTEQLNFAAEIGDDYINLEIAVAKSDLSITDSFKLMVTYSTPNCLKADGTTGYNAFHMTACDVMPSGWSGTADAYESYNCADIALTTKTPGDEGILVFAVLGLLAIAGAAVTIKSKI